MSYSVTDNHLLIYVEHLIAVKEDMNVRFEDSLDLKVFRWLVEPSASNINECDSNMQEMLIDLQVTKKREQFMGHMNGQVSRSSVITDFLNCGRKYR